MFSRLLSSYLDLKPLQNVKVSFVVVENDTKQTILGSLDKLTKEQKKDIHYYWEKKLGIPIARNKCVSIAKQIGATHIIFVDDDEWLPKDWLIKLWNYYKLQPSDSVIQGPAIPQFPTDSPKYFEQFFAPRKLSTGDKLHMCATNNVLVPLPILQEHNLAFDETYPLAGGTDSKLFRQAKALGVDLIYCSEAYVYEEITTDRLTYSWLSKRHFRVGLTIGEHKHFKNRLQMLTFCSKKLLDGIWRSLKSGYYFAFGRKEKHAKTWIKACRSFGEMAGPLGIKVNSYQKTQGH